MAVPACPVRAGQKTREYYILKPANDMKRKIYSLILAALACTSSASAQWNTNATSVCIYPTTGGDEASSVIAKRLPDGKTWIGWRTWDKGQELEDGTVKQLYFRNYVQLLDKDG